MLKKQIVFLIPTMGIGGAERVVANLVNNLNNNYNITLLTLNHEILYSLPDNVKIIKFKSKSLKTVLPELVIYLYKNTPDLLISNMSLTNIISILTRMIVKKKFKIMLIEHSTPSIKFKKDKYIRRIIPFLITNLYKHADCIVSVSNGVKNDLFKLGVINNITTIYNPIVPKSHYISNNKIQHEWFENENLKVILSVGRLEPVKNIALLIKAFNKLYSHRKNVRLMIIGDGSEKDRLKNLTMSLNIQDVVQFLGYKSDPYSYMKQSDVFVLSSNLEGLSNVLIEALACGTKVVSTNCPHGPSEILDNGKYGILVPVNDVDSLALAINQSLEEEINKELLIKRASNFSIENSINQYKELIDKLI